MSALLLTGCLYHFAGGGLPPHIKSVAVLPFDNETPQPTLQRELYDLMRRDVENRLGLREAAEGKADAIVRGKILRYDPDIPAAYSADRNAQATTTERKLQITIDVDIIDQTTGRTLWTRKGMLEEGTYAERAEADGRRQALTKVGERHHRRSAVAMVRRARSGKSAYGCLVFILSRRGDALFRLQHRQRVLARVPVPGCDDAGVALRGAQRQRGDHRAPRAQADSLGLPEGAQKIQIRRKPNQIWIWSEYIETVELPWKLQEIDFNPHAERVF